MTVAVVLLNWNGKALLEQFLPILISNTSPDVQLVIADNASKDDSVKYIQDNYAQITVLQNDSNMGFAGGYNWALQQVKADYYVLLNTDIEVGPNWLEPMLDLMENDPAVAACQPKMRSFKHPELFEYAGAAGGFIDQFGYPFCRGRLFESLEEDKQQYDDNIEIFWATGACLMIRAQLFHSAGRLDEDFFAHMEEIDLCWRLKSLGHKIMYCAKSEVYHVGGGTLPRDNPRKTYLNFRNNLSLLYKNSPSPGIYWIFPLRVLLDGLAGFKFLIFDSPRDFWAVIRAHLSFYAQLPRNTRKRAQIQKAATVRNVSGIYRKSVVWAYFMKGKRRWDQLSGIEQMFNR